jgi:hypothetical protein
LATCDAAQHRVAHAGANDHVFAYLQVAQLTSSVSVGQAVHC